MTAKAGLQDPALVETLVNEKLATIAREVGNEGWKWVEAAIDLPFGCERGKRRIAHTTVPLTDEEQSRLNTLTREYDAIGEQYRDGSDLPDEIDARLTEIDAELTPLVSRPLVYEPDEIARAGVFMSLLHDGRIRIDRGYVRPEDEPFDSDGDQPGNSSSADAGPAVTIGGQLQDGEAEPDGDEAVRPLPDRLVSELDCRAHPRAPRCSGQSTGGGIHRSAPRPVSFGVPFAWCARLRTDRRHPVLARQRARSA